LGRNPNEIRPGELVKRAFTGTRIFALIEEKLLTAWGTDIWWKSGEMSRGT
jgi:hypothetical protein